MIINQAPGYATGINFGDRILYVDGTMWAIDEKNLLVAEVNVIPSTGGLFNKKTTPMDFMDGYIYKVG